MPTSLMASPPHREVVLVAYDGARLINIAAVLDLFALANDVTGKSAAFRYNTRIVTRAGGPLPTASGVALLTDSFADVSNLKIDTLLLAGGPGAYAASKDAVLVGWIRDRAAATRRTCSTCTGTYLLAAAGLLRGRTATTHWQDAHQLQA